MGYLGASDTQDLTCSNLDRRRSVFVSVSDLVAHFFQREKRLVGAGEAALGKDSDASWYL